MVAIVALRVFTMKRSVGSSANCLRFENGNRRRRAPRSLTISLNAASSLGNVLTVLSVASSFKNTYLNC